MKRASAAGGRSRILCITLGCSIASTFAQGCEQKMGVEKRAEQIAASASASVSAVAVSASASATPDPKLERFKALEQQLKARALLYQTTLQRIYASGKKEDIEALRAFFPATKEGAKEASEVAKEAAFTGKEGMSLHKFEITGVEFDEKLQNCTVSFYEEETQRGKPRCVLFKLKWQDQGGVWLRVERTKSLVVDCQS